MHQHHAIALVVGMLSFMQAAHAWHPPSRSVDISSRSKESLVSEACLGHHDADDKTLTRVSEILPNDKTRLSAIVTCPVVGETENVPFRTEVSCTGAETTWVCNHRRVELLVPTKLGVLYVLPDEVEVAYAVAAVQLLARTESVVVSGLGSTKVKAFIAQQITLSRTKRANAISMQLWPYSLLVSFPCKRPSCPTISAAVWNPP